MRPADRSVQRPARPEPHPARREAARHAAAVRLALSPERLRRPEGSAARRDAAAGLPQEASSRAPFEFAARAQALRLVPVWRPPPAGTAEAPETACPSGKKKVAGSAPPVASARQAPSLPPEVLAGAYGRAGPQSAVPAGRYARVARPPVAAAHAGVVPRAASDAGVVQRQGAAAAQDAGAVVLLQAARDAAAVLQRVAAARDAEVPRPAAARPSAAPWVFRSGPILPWFPAPRRAARSAHAKRRLRAASRSELTWQAARCEVLS